MIMLENGLVDDKQLTCTEDGKVEKDCTVERSDLSVGCLLALRPSNMPVYLRDGSAQRVLRAATLRLKLKIELSTSPSHSILTPGRPVPALTL